MICLRHLFLLTVSVVLGTAQPLPHAPAPNDSYWLEQWHLENLEQDTTRRGVDMNAREAWATTQGQGMVIAVVDTGVELTHPDLVNQAASTLHWNFEADGPFGDPPQTNSFDHGTSVAGLAAAQGNNNLGVIGIAPGAKFASWVIYNTNTTSGTFVSPEKLAQMFQFKNQEVQIQNHSWAKGTEELIPLSPLEDAAISNAVTLGRGGKGVIIVNAAGNFRIIHGRNANDDARISDHRAIAVAAVRADGRVATYSNPGASILVSATSGDLQGGHPNLFTTDKVGLLGYNRIGFVSDPALSDYVFGAFGFGGTSAAAPLISGVAALVLSVNPDLHYRDVQQIFLHASHQTDPADPDLIPNGAGYLVSHNTGFGLVDAGRAVRLSQQWISRPPTASVLYSSEETKTIPDGGLQLILSNDGTPIAGLFPAPSLGPQMGNSTLALPLVFVGRATEDVTIDLTGKAALIERGGAEFSAKVERVAAAGAEFAIIYNNTGTNQLFTLGGTDFVPIPTVAVTQADGESLRTFAEQSPANRVQIVVEKQTYTFNVTETLLTEHVRLRLRTDHPLRGDLRITLISPDGTPSVMQRFGPDFSAGPADWTYMSTHHFYESSAGEWRVEISDQSPEAPGSVLFASLEIIGVPITDSDTDGLDDAWEIAQFTNLDQGAADDPDADGLSNAREQILQTPAAVDDHTFAIALSRWSPEYIRLSWDAVPGAEYEIYGSASLNEPMALLDTVIPDVPNPAWFNASTATTKFYQVRRK